MFNDPARPRIYIAIVLAAAFLCAAGFSAFAWHLGPPVGDLTRLSVRSEKAFGWAGSVTVPVRFHHRQLTLSDLLAGADPGEILVFGDSFTVNIPVQVSWLDTLFERTGMTPAVVHIHGLREVVNYLKSQAFRDNPPKTIIVETVERSAFWRAISAVDPASGCSTPARPARITGKGPVELESISYRRRTAFRDFQELMSWGALAARNRVAGSTQVIEVGLSNRTLFTHAANHRLLLLAGDIELHQAGKFGRWTRQEARDKYICSLRALVRLGQGRLHFTLAPDKRTIYAPHIATALPEKYLDIHALTREALGDIFIDLRPALTAAVENGVKDVYWPNDTHWSPAGRAIVGRLIAERVMED